MCLKPIKTLYLREQKRRITQTYNIRSFKINFGKIGIQSLESGKIKANQLEAVRRTITNKMNRKVKIWIRAFPQTPITKKPSEVRMGRGKGNIDHWVCKVSKGKILMEMNAPNIKMLHNVLESSIQKLPLKSRIIENFSDIH